MSVKVKFKEWDCILVFTKYRNNDRIALELIDANDGDCIAMASINLPNENLLPTEIAIKDYSENDGMVQSLVKSGVIDYPKRWVTSGYVNIPICDLLISK